MAFYRFAISDYCSIFGSLACVSNVSPVTCMIIEGTVAVFLFFEGCVTQKNPCAFNHLCVPAIQRPALVYY
jgi:hypothetical protein